MNNGDERRSMRSNGETLSIRSEETRELLRRIPKAELHLHLDGSVRPETILELGAEYGVPMPRTDPVSLRDYMHVRDATDLVDYLGRFEITLSVMQTAEALERVAYELASDLADENVAYAEVRFSPALNTRLGLSYGDTVDAVLRGLDRARAATGIRTGIIICAIRSLPPETSVALAEVAGEYRDRGVVGFDLAGAELGFPASAHAEAFRVAHDLGLRATVHAGEAAGPESIRDALDTCRADRIGHGTRLFQDEGLLREVRDARIPIEICLTSNVQTRAVERFESHPLRRYFDEGLVVTLNTDNRLMSHTTLTEEYLRAHLHLGLSITDLGRIAKMSFDSAFTREPGFASYADAAVVRIRELTGGGDDDMLKP
jgi:adenosine deaminase